MPPTVSSPEQVARIIRQCLEDGGRVEIDGLGAFRRGADGDFVFLPQNRPKVFLAYVVEDSALVDRLYDDLVGAGFDPWLDRKKLTPGQNWPRAIERAISVSDFFIGCFSGHSVEKRGRFQSELRFALDCATRQPMDDVFFIPARLEECEVPSRIALEYQYVDLFPDWNRGLKRVVATMHGRKKPLPLAG